MNCIFCQIAARVIKAAVVAETPEVIAFRDLNPQAPTHILVIPKRHISTLNDLRAEDAGLMGQMLLVATELARTEGFAEKGYRTVFNCGADGGQSVYHIHLHVLAGRQLGWPPG